MIIISSIPTAPDLIERILFTIFTSTSDRKSNYYMPNRKNKPPTVDENILEQNARKNEWVTSWVKALYAGALFEIVVIVITHVVPAIQHGETPVVELSVASVLGALSVTSLDFYLTVVVNFRETTRAQWFSLLLVIALLALLFVGIIFPRLWLISIGIGCICLKTWQLYRDTKKHGKVTAEYFRNNIRTYLVLFLLTGVLGVLAHSGIVNILPESHGLPAYDSTMTEIQKLSLSDADVLALKSKVNGMYSEWKEISGLHNTVVFIEILFLLLLIVFAAHRFFVRKHTLEDLFEDARKYYKDHPDEHPGGGSSSPGGGGSKAVKAIALILALRPLISSIAGMIATAVYIATTSSGSVVIAISCFFVVALTSSFGFVLNDYVDVEKDRIGHPRRAISSGVIGRMQARYIIVFLAVLSLSIASTLTFLSFIIDAITILFLSIYSYINNRFGVWANTIAALCSSFTIVFGMAVGAFSTPLLLMSGATFFMIVGREILLDIRDLKADTSFGKTSVPIRLGVDRAVNICMYLFIGSSALLIVAALMWGTLASMVLAGFAMPLLLWVGFLYYRFERTSARLERFMIFSRLVFLFIIPALLL